MLVSARRAARVANEKDVTALVAPIISAFVKLHNEERYAHPEAFGRYVTMEAFNAIRAMIEAQRATAARGCPAVPG